jgi:hypothetical protein
VFLEMHATLGVNLSPAGSSSRKKKRAFRPLVVEASVGWQLQLEQTMVNNFVAVGGESVPVPRM